MRVLVPLAVVAVVVAASSPARAQYTNSYGYSFDNPASFRITRNGLELIRP